MNDKAKTTQKIDIVTSSAIYQQAQNIYTYMHIKKNRGYINFPAPNYKQGSIPLDKNMYEIASKLCVCNFLCRTELLDESILIDPEMEVKEVGYLNLSLCGPTIFLF